MIEKYADNVYLLHEFLSEKECVGLIKQTETIGFQEAKIISNGVEISAPEIRNNDRVIQDSEEIASEWWRRFNELLPDYSKQWNAVSLNERLRFYRYKQSQIFRFHRDTPYEAGGRVSNLSLIIYLNSSFEGGETDFREFKIAPSQGAALVFPHNMLHEGAAVKSGVKYAVRTDVMCVKSV